MVTGLSDDTAYILDWSEADADSYDLDDGTEGTNYCKLPILRRIAMAIEQDGMSMAFFGGDGFLLRYDKTKEVIRINTKVQSRTDLGYIAKFIHKRQSKADDPDYLVVQFGTNDQLPAYDYDGTNKNGVFRGWFKKVPMIGWVPDENLLHEVQIEFLVVWA